MTEGTLTFASLGRTPDACQNQTLWKQGMPAMKKERQQITTQPSSYKVRMQRWLPMGTHHTPSTHIKNQEKGEHLCRRSAITISSAQIGLTSSCSSQHIKGQISWSCQGKYPLSPSNHISFSKYLFTAVWTETTENGKADIMTNLRSAASNQVSIRLQGHWRQCNKQAGKTWGPAHGSPVHSWRHCPGTPPPRIYRWLDCWRSSTCTGTDPGFGHKNLTSLPLHHWSYWQNATSFFLLGVFFFPFLDLFPWFLWHGNS